VLAADLLNPYRVHATTRFLTDSLAACCAALAISAVWRSALRRSGLLDGGRPVPAAAFSHCARPVVVEMMHARGRRGGRVLL
jgi:hypothetical protein